MNNRDIKRLHELAELANCNPFAPRRFELEKKILGAKFVPEDAISWNRRHDASSGDRANVLALTQLAVDTITHIRDSIRDKNSKLASELHQDYSDVVAYVLLYRHLTPVSLATFEGTDTKSQSEVQAIWRAFLSDFQTMRDVGKSFSISQAAAAHLFACLCQVHRAFWMIFDYVLGDSRPIATMREKIWESIFSCDLSRYQNGLHLQLRDLATLVTGPSGTGKELVARAIGMSQYIPFDLEAESFRVDANRFLPLNLSALSPTLIESELFGHHRGAFTGAIADRVGWLETCPAQGAVFLDEIGELDGSLQVKLLRVLQERTYCRLGEIKMRRFKGKIISATNRDLGIEVHSGRFREDFYYRICSDRIETPSLRDQLDDRPADLPVLVLWIAKKLMGETSAKSPALPSKMWAGHSVTSLTRQTQSLADDASGWIEENLGTNYRWPGNIRELEQCVSSFMLRREYIPLLQPQGDPRTPAPAWAEPILKGTATADELLRLYCANVYEKNGSYEQTAQILGIDRRTVKSKLRSKD